MAIKFRHQPKRTEKSDSFNASATNATKAIEHSREVTLRMAHLMDSGLMYAIPFVFGLFLGHSPLRLAIGFVLQSLAFITLCVTVYGPFYPASFYRAWDLVYRYQELKCADFLKWDTIQPAQTIQAPKPNQWMRWMLRLVLRKGSGIHLLMAVTLIENAFVAIPVVTLASYYVMMLDRTGVADLQGLLSEIQKMIKPETPVEPRSSEESMDEMDARQLKEIREGLDTTFNVGAPVCAAAIMVWWLGERGKTWSQSVFGI